MNDRLGDLPSWALQEAQAEPENQPPPQQASSKGRKKKHQLDDDMGDVEMGKQQPKHMEHFFREVETIKEDIEAVKKATKSIGDINEAAIQATTTEEENVLSKRLRPLVDQTNKRAKRTKNLLGLLKEETKKLESAGDIQQSDLR